MASGLNVRLTFNTSAIASAHVHRATLTFEGLEKYHFKDISVFDGGFSLDWIRFLKIENLECGEETC